MDPSADAHQGRPPKHRRRQLLSAYYGGVGEDDEGSNKDPRDLDSTAFDADLHVQTALREMPLKGLLSRHGELVQEIRTLDSDMQMLVYENYNKFISATSTIRNMKDNVEQMETEMTQLLGNMDDISACSDSINETLSGRRERIEKLTGIHSLLKKLQFLFDLPSRLKKSIELGALQQAVKYYSSTAPILSRHEHLPSLKKIRTEVETTATGLRIALRSRINDPQMSILQATTDVELLLQMGEKEEDVQKLYLTSRQKRLETSLNVAEEEQKGMEAAVAAVESGSFSVCDFLDRIHGSVLADFLVLFEHFSRLFLRSTAASVESKTAAAALWNTVAKTITDRYFKVTRAALSTPGLTSSDLLKGLQSMHVVTAEVQELMPDARFRDQAADIAQGTVHGWVKLGFDGLQSDLSRVTQWLVSDGDGVDKLPDALAVTVAGDMTDRDRADTALDAVIQRTQTLVTHLRPFGNKPAAAETERKGEAIAESAVEPEPDVLTSIRPVLVDLVHVFFQKAFLCLDDAVQGIIPAEQERMNGEVPPRAVISLCKFAIEIEKKGIAQVLKILGNQFPVSHGQNMELLNATELIKRFRSTAKSLLSEYVELRGRRVSVMIRKSLETPNWLSAKEPRDVRMVMELVVQEVAAIQEEVNSVFGDLVNQAPSRSSESGSSYSRRSHEPRGAYGHGHGHGYGSGLGGGARYGTAVDSNIERLFARKIEIFSAVEFSTSSIVTGIVKVFMKSFLEGARLCTFGKNGFQQIQIDVQFIRESLAAAGHVEPLSVLDILVDETVASAARRCDDPSPLDPTIVEGIVRNKIKNDS